MNKLNDSKTLKFKITGDLLRKVRKSALKEGFGEYELPFYVRELIFKALGVKKHR